MLSKSIVPLNDVSTTSQEYEENINVTLKRLLHSLLNYVIFSYLNINSIRNTFGDADKIIDGNINILDIAERKKMNFFPIISSYITIISPYILDITERKAGLMVFVKSHIPSRNLNDFKIPSNIQIILFEVSLRKEKWLVASIFNASCQKKFPWYLTYLQEFYSTRYENVIILCDFNIGAENNVMNDFF